MPLKIRNVLLKSFVFVYVLVIISYAIFHFFPNLVGIIESGYGVSALEARILIAHFHGQMKMLALTFFLVPALAMHCEFLSKCCLQKTCETDTEYK